MSLDSIGPTQFQPQVEKTTSSKRKSRDSEIVQKAAHRQLSQTDKQSELDGKQAKLLEKVRKMKKRDRVPGGGEQVHSKRLEDSEDTLSSGPETKKRARKSAEPAEQRENPATQEELSMDDLADRIKNLSINDNTE